MVAMVAGLGTQWNIELFDSPGRDVRFNTCRTVGSEVAQIDEVQ